MLQAVKKRLRKYKALRKTYKVAKRGKIKTGCFVSSLLAHRENPDEGAITLSVVAIIINEAPYIEEWIRYHQMVGVERFYLFDNGSTDDTLQIVQKYVENGLVVLTHYPGKGMQLSAYNRALKKYRYQTRYMAFIDADEFLYSCEKERSVRQQVEDLFALYPEAGGLALNWRMFGSSGHLTKPEGGVLENYLYRANEDGKGNGCIKSIVDPRRVYKYTHSHYPTYYRGYYSVDEDGQKVIGWSHPKTTIRKLRINHYFTKSREEWIERRSKGRVDGKDNDERSIEVFQEYDNNDIYDDGMRVFAEALKGPMRS